MAANPGDLTTLANVRQYLGVTNTDDDAILQRMLSACSTNCARFLGRNLLTQSYTETRDGNDSSRMLLKQTPVTAVASLNIYTPSFPWGFGILAQGNNTPPTQVPVSPDGAQYQPGFAFDEFSIYLSGYTFYRGVQNVIIAYTAGYTTTPFDIEEAVIEWIADRFKFRGRVGEKSKALPQGGSVSYELGFMPDRVKEALQLYKRQIPV